MSPRAKNQLAQLLLVVAWATIDAIFRALRLWQDTNHNGTVESIGLDFQESKRIDQYGDQFRYRVVLKDARNTKVSRWAWDVFLLVGPNKQS